MPSKQPPEVRYWKFVKKTESCWLWTGSKNNKGYAQISVRMPSGKKLNLGSRLAYELFVGPIPDGLYVLHKCDNPACVRPDHLFLGTQKDNGADMVAKGRQEKHERHHFAKLNCKAVVEIRRLYSLGRTQDSIASEFKIARSVVSRIVNNKIWQGAVA